MSKSKSKISKGYRVTLERKGEALLEKKFYTLRSAEKWACKMVRTFLVCETIATVVSNKTGEIMSIITR